MTNASDQSEVIALLADPVRSVRLEAVTLLAPLRQHLSATHDAALAAAADEFRAAQMAIASRPEAHAALGEFAGSLGRTEEALGHFEQAPTARFES